jgi:periplasmic divalent cation tolerance protein
VSDKIVVLVTVGSAREGKKIARALLESRLAACVNITAPIQSLFRWEGKVASAREHLLVIKTTRGRFKHVKSRVCEIHSYTTPEIISLPITDGSAEYLQWIENSVTSTGRA